MREDDFSALFRATSRDILAFLLRRCPIAEDAADCLAETYLVAWEKRRQMPNEPDTRPWLFGVARNVMRRGREREHRATEATRDLAREVLASGAVAPAPAIADTDPVVTALAELPELDREIVTMICWDGLTPREVGKALHCSANVVRVRAHRARARLRALLAAAAEADAEPDLRQAGSPSAAG
ncbi:MAG TPA: RNA polymerase sigma factor [Solirubrobacteraceae bacterium]|nr:RNA polymerase sigma factor [Solirubrobacteraceae bacterium]